MLKVFQFICAFLDAMANLILLIEKWHAKCNEKKNPPAPPHKQTDGSDDLA